MTDSKALIEALRRGDYAALDGLGKEEKAVLYQIVRGMEAMDPRPVQQLLRDGRDSVVVPVDEFLGSNEFMGTDFYANVYDAWKDELRYVLAPENKINLWLVRGSMGGGKSYAATLALIYKMYEVSTLIDPADSMGLAPGSQLVCGLFNATKYLADDVNYGYLTAFLSRCNYFYRVREQIRAEDRTQRIHGNVLDLPKGIRIALGSDQFMMLGKNVLWALLDEANWRDRIIVAGEQDKVYSSFHGVYRRIKTRFSSDGSYIPNALFVVVSSEREMSPTMDRLCDQYREDPHTHITQFSLWDVKPEPSDNLDPLYVGVPKQTGMLPRLFDAEEDALSFATDGGRMVQVPRRFQPDFEADILGALNDLAGVRIETGEAKFFYAPERVAATVVEGYKNPVASETVMHGLNSPEELSDYFLQDRICRLEDAVKKTYRPLRYPHSARTLHIDLAINHDACGVSMTCLGDPVVQSIEQESKRVKLPEFTVWTDFFLRIKAPPGDRIHFGAIRKLIVWLDKHCGFPIAVLSWDGFESEDSVQIMQRRGYKTIKTSVDKTLAPYSTLRDLVNYGRLQMPQHTYAQTELSNLIKVRRKGSSTVKIDHPRVMRMGSQQVEGSKDVADALAGAAYNLVTTVAVQRMLRDPASLGAPPKSARREQDTVRPKEVKRKTLRELVLETAKEDHDG